MCKTKEENIVHIASKCSKLAQLEYKRRHDKVAGSVHWSLCNKFSVQCSQQWYQHTAESVIDKKNVEIPWDVQWRLQGEARGPWPPIFGLAPHLS